jgi:hypothetical protein
MNALIIVHAVSNMDSGRLVACRIMIISIMRGYVFWISGGRCGAHRASRLNYRMPHAGYHACRETLYRTLWNASSSALKDT